MKKTFRAAKERAKAFFRGGSQASPSVQVLPQNNGASAVQSPALFDPTNSDIGQRPSSSPQVVIHNPSKEEMELSPPPNNSSTSAGSPQQSFMFSGHKSVAQLSLPSLAIVRDGTEHPRSSSRVSVYNDNEGPERPLNMIPYTAQGYGDVFNKQMSFENANLYEVHGNQNVNYNINTGTALLDRLARYAMLDATSDASARDPPPRCHPGTRLSILQSIQERLRDPNKKAQMDWLQGAAGVGKSAVMQTIAEAESESNALCASLFFSRPNERDDSRKVFSTIAYQFAIKESSYQRYLAEKIAVDPWFLDRTMDRLFNDLIIIPFAQRQLLHDPRSCVILLDGLDECKGNREQCRIIELIHGFVSNHPNVPLRWVIASRPEEHLRITFSEVRTDLQDSFWEKEIPVDSEQSVLDVELYLHNEFTRIRKRYPDLTVAYDKWPSETHFLTISRAASGLFVFASTVIRFIDDDENPVYRLNIVIAFLEKRLKQHSWINPLELLDALYERILSEMSLETLKIAKLILGYLVVFLPIGLGDNRSPFWMCNVLGLEQYVVYGALRKLRSVLSFPEPKDAYAETVHFLHASFSDYLKDHERSRIYSIDLNETATYLFRRYMTVLRQYAERGSYDVDYSWSIDSLMKISEKEILVPKRDFVDKAGYYWAVLLRKYLKHSSKIVFQFLLPLEDIVEQIKQLDYSYPFSLSSFRKVKNLISYLERDVPACLHEGLIQDVPLTSLDKERFLKSVYIRQWISGPSGYSDPFEDRDFQVLQGLGGSLKELENFLQNNCSDARFILGLLQSTDVSELKVTIFGTQPSKCRVVVVESNESRNNTYSFPYIV